MYSGLSSLNNAACAKDSVCSALQNAYCYSAGWFTPDCTTWRSGIYGPTAPAAPKIDTTPGSPTYGQAIGPDGKVVDSAAQAQALIDAQIAASAAADRVAAQEQMGAGPYSGGPLSIFGWNPFGDPLNPKPATDFTTVALVVASVAALMLVRR